MNKILATAAALLIGLSAFAQQLPQVKLADAKGKAVPTASFIDGKTPFAITFWASWCKPCQKELEALVDIAPDWDADFPLRIYAICVDDSRSIARAKALAATSLWPATILYDSNEEFSRAMSISTIPHVFVYDKNGKQVFSHVGFIPGDEEELLEKIKEAK